MSDKKEAWCGLRNDEFFVQCCCNCKYHRPVHFHCCTEPKPDGYTRESHGCICFTQKGWACAPTAFEGQIFDNWPEHSVGCELYDPVKPHTEEMNERHRMLVRRRNATYT